MSPDKLDLLGRPVLYYHVQSSDPQAALITQVDSDGLVWLTVFDPVSGPIVRKRVKFMAHALEDPGKDAYCARLSERPAVDAENDDEDEVTIPKELLKTAIADLKGLRREVQLLWKAQGIQDDVFPEGELGEFTVMDLEAILAGDAPWDDDDDDEDLEDDDDEDDDDED